MQKKEEVHMDAETYDELEKEFPGDPLVDGPDSVVSGAKALSILRQATLRALQRAVQRKKDDAAALKKKKKNKVVVVAIAAEKKKKKKK